MKTLKQTIMTRDGLTSTKADELIDQFKQELKEILEDDTQDTFMSLESAKDLLMDYFSLEPDYLDEFFFDLF